MYGSQQSTNKNTNDYKAHSIFAKQFQNVTASNYFSRILSYMDELVVSGLPLSAEYKLEVHHCSEKKWKEEIRFSPFPIGIQNNAEIVIYLGGNTHAGDAQRLKTLLPNL